jgi:hypothetical protein
VRRRHRAQNTSCTSSDVGQSGTIDARPGSPPFTCAHAVANGPLETLARAPVPIVGTEAFFEPM